jgi:hypothetical protein
MMDKYKITLDNEWCNEDFIQNRLLKNGYNFVGIYYGENNRKLGEITTTYKDCIKSSASYKYKKFLYELTDDEFINFDANDKRYNRIETDRLGDVNIE